MSGGFLPSTMYTLPDMDERLIPIRGTLRGNASLFRSALAGIGDGDDWLHRSGEANHLAFLGVHLVGARHYVVNFLGGSSTDPLEKYHSEARGIEDVERFPPPGKVLAAWDGVAPALNSALASVAAEFLDAESGLPFPAPGPTRLDALAFFAQHETYHIGQMCLIRRIHGLAAAEWPRS